MSGTSLDGLDACVIKETEFNGPIEILEKNHSYIPNEALEIFKKATETGQIELNDLLMAEVVYTDAVGKQCKNLCNQTNEKISVIGFHGQTIWHLPNAGTTLQIGFAEKLASLTGIPVIHQFRRGDMARSGQGAPLTPLFHQHQFARDTEKIGILNLGGIANLTLLIPGKPTTGWDIGPANTLSDLWFKLHEDEGFDRDGRYASSGDVNNQLLNLLIDDPYFKLKPPKSTGREYFNLGWLHTKLGTMRSIAPQHVQATLNCLTATLIHQSLPKDLDILAVCGGGVHNNHLMDQIDDLVESLVVTTDVFSIDPDYVEAACFGWLALQNLDSISSDLRSITGANASGIIGSLVRP